jgi:ribosomal silencing factor RsfS
MAELNINERQAGDVTVLDMDGRITIGDGFVCSFFAELHSLKTLASSYAILSVSFGDFGDSL